VTLFSIATKPRRTPNAERRTPNAKRRTPNAERRSDDPQTNEVDDLFHDGAFGRLRYSFWVDRDRMIASQSTIVI
jgi:hypothetical protein